MEKLPQYKSVQGRKWNGAMICQAVPNKIPKNV
jgi:hypothetical protein